MSNPVRVIVIGARAPDRIADRVLSMVTPSERGTTRLLSTRALGRLAPWRANHVENATLFEMERSTLWRWYRRWQSAGFRVALDAELVTSPKDPDASATEPAASGTSTGKGIGLAVIDAGGFRQHVELGSRLRTFDARVKPGSDPYAAKAEEVTPGDAYLNSHGVAVASVAAGESKCKAPAPECSLFGYHARFAWDAAMAMDHIMEEFAEVRVVFTAQYFEDGRIDGVPPEVERIRLDSTLAALSDTGRIFCAAAGNNDVGTPMAQPALSRFALTIGGWDESTTDTTGPDADDAPHIGSTPGPGGEPMKPDALGPWRNYLHAEFDANLNETYGTNGGTSMASAHIAGQVTAWCQDRSWLTLPGLRALLPEICVRLVMPDGSDYPDTEQGRGAIDARLWTY